MNKDKYGILEETTRLIPRIKNDKNYEVNYQQANLELVKYLDIKVKQSRDLKELMDVWIYSRKGLEALRLRRRRVKDEIGTIEPNASMLDALDEGLEKKNSDFEKIPFYENNLRFECFNLTSEAYSSRLTVTIADKTSLAAVLVLSHLRGGAYEGLDYNRIIRSLIFDSYFDSLDDLEASVVGNVRENIWDFHFGNKEFIDLFATGLKNILLRDRDALLGLELLRLANELLIQVWADDTMADVFGVYSEIEKVLEADKTTGITRSLVDNLIYTEQVVVTKEYSKESIKYVVNADSLYALTHLISDLGLAELEENKLLDNLVTSKIFRSLDDANEKF